MEPLASVAELELEGKRERLTRGKREDAFCFSK